MISYLPTLKDHDLLSPEHCESTDSWRNNVFNDSSKMLFPIVRDILWNRKYISQSIVVRPLDVLPLLYISADIFSSFVPIESQVYQMNLLPEDLKYFDGYCRSNVFHLQMHDSLSNGYPIVEKKLIVSLPINSSVISDNNRNLEQNLFKSIHLSPEFALKSMMRCYGTLFNSSDDHQQRGITSAPNNTLKFEVILPNCIFQFKCLQPLPLLRTPFIDCLATSSAEFATGSLRTPLFGYVTLNQTRKVVLLQETDGNIGIIPTVGVWIRVHDDVSNQVHSSAPSLLHDLSVWSACVRYIHTALVKDRVYVDRETFLVVIIHQQQFIYYECTHLNGMLSTNMVATPFRFESYELDICLPNINSDQEALAVLSRFHRRFDPCVLSDASVSNEQQSHSHSQSIHVDSVVENDYCTLVDSGALVDNINNSKSLENIQSADSLQEYTETKEIFSHSREVHSINEPSVNEFVGSSSVKALLLIKEMEITDLQHQVAVLRSLLTKQYRQQLNCNDTEVSASTQVLFTSEELVVQRELLLFVSQSHSQALTHSENTSAHTSHIENIPPISTSADAFDIIRKHDEATVNISTEQTNKSTVDEDDEHDDIIVDFPAIRYTAPPVECILTERFGLEHAVVCEPSSIIYPSFASMDLTIRAGGGPASSQVLNNTDARNDADLNDEDAVHTSSSMQLDPFMTDILVDDICSTYQETQSIINIELKYLHSRVK